MAVLYHSAADGGAADELDFVEFARRQLAALVRRQQRGIHRHVQANDLLLHPNPKFTLAVRDRDWIGAIDDPAPRPVLGCDSNGRNRCVGHRLAVLVEHSAADDQIGVAAVQVVRFQLQRDWSLARIDPVGDDSYMALRGDDEGKGQIRLKILQSKAALIISDHFIAAAGVAKTTHVPWPDTRAGVPDPHENTLQWPSLFILDAAADHGSFASVFTTGQRDALSPLACEKRLTISNVFKCISSVAGSWSCYERGPCRFTRISTDGPPLFTAYLRDITEQKRAEQQRNVRLAVTHALSEAASVGDGASGVLRAVCENLGWDVGFFWTFKEGGTALHCTKSWQRPDVPVEEFETASCSRTFEPGEGLPGRVCASGAPTLPENFLSISR